MDVDAWFQRFREAHYHLVKRVIGSEVRSLRGVPASRLEHTSREPLFPDLWGVINEMTKLDWPALARPPWHWQNHGLPAPAPIWDRS